MAKISNIFSGCLIFLIFLGYTVDAGSKPTYEEEIEIRVPPPPRLHVAKHRNIIEPSSCISGYNVADRTSKMKEWRFIGLVVRKSALTLCILLDSSFCFNAISLGLSIVNI